MLRSLAIISFMVLSFSVHADSNSSESGPSEAASAVYGAIQEINRFEEILVRNFLARNVVKIEAGVELADNIMKQVLVYLGSSEGQEIRELAGNWRGNRDAETQLRGKVAKMIGLIGQRMNLVSPRGDGRYGSISPIREELNGSQGLYRSSVKAQNPRFRLRRNAYHHGEVGIVIDHGNFDGNTSGTLGIYASVTSPRAEIATPNFFVDGGLLGTDHYQVHFQSQTLRIDLATATVVRRTSPESIDQRLITNRGAQFGMARATSASMTRRRSLEQLYIIMGEGQLMLPSIEYSSCAKLLGDEYRRLEGSLDLARILK